MNAEVILITGMKHSGKSVVGKALAGLSGLPFYDLDQLIEDEYRKNTGRMLPVREIYSAEGTEKFRRVEADAAAAAGGISRGVIALGGGTPENQAAMDLLASLGTVVLLEEDPDLIYRRIEAGGIPPFLQDPVKNPREMFDELYQRRRIIYRRCSDITFQVQGRTVDQAAESLLAVLNNLSKEEL
ncbi:MAG: shikimate kinase [Spirochaetia bacterium]